MYQRVAPKQYFFAVVIVALLGLICQFLVIQPASAAESVSPDGFLDATAPSRIVASENCAVPEKVSSLGEANLPVDGSSTASSAGEVDATELPQPSYGLDEIEQSEVLSEPSPDGRGSVGDDAGAGTTEDATSKNYLSSGSMSALQEVIPPVVEIESDGHSGASVLPCALPNSVEKTSAAVQEEKQGLDSRIYRNQWVSVGGKTYYYNNNGQVQKGWCVSDSYKHYGLQRFWLDKTTGALVFSRLIPASEAGWWAYATKSGYVVRGRYVENGRVYLANNDGKLENPGWLVSGSYTNGNLQRYYVDPSTHAAKTGYFTVGSSKYYGCSAVGYVLRSAVKVGSSLVSANNDGVLQKSGWIVTSRFQQGLQRYWFRDYKAAVSALIPASEAGWWAYATKSGYVVRGRYVENGRVYLANNDGKLENPGWLVSGSYTNGNLQRYYVDPSTHAAKTGYFFVSKKLYYGVNAFGYIKTGRFSGGGVSCYADNSGAIKTTEALDSEVASVKNNRDAIVTIVDDDGMYQWESSLAKLAIQYQLSMTEAGAIRCVNQNLFAWQTLCSSDYVEMISHSWNHVDVSTITDVDQAWLDAEIGDAKQYLLDAFGNDQISYVCPNNQSTPEILDYLVANGYFAVRQGTRGSNSLSPEWGGGPGQWLNLMTHGMGTYWYEPKSLWTEWVEDAIKNQQWMIEMWHTVGDFGGYAPVSVADAEAHLSYLKQQQDAGNIWVANFTEATKYLQEKQHSQLT